MVIGESRNSDTWTHRPVSPHERSKSRSMRCREVNARSFACHEPKIAERPSQRAGCKEQVAKSRLQRAYGRREAHLKSLGSGRIHSGSILVFSCLLVASDDTQGLVSLRAARSGTTNVSHASEARTGRQILILRYQRTRSHSPMNTLSMRH